MENTANKNNYSSEIKSQYNSLSLEKELDWFQKILLLRGKITFEESSQEEELSRIELPDLNNDPSDYANLVKKYDMGPEERVVLILSLIPHIRPSILDILNLKNQNFDIPFTEFGGMKAERHKGFLPTGETAIFLLAGTDLDKRFSLMRLFDKDHFLVKEKIIYLDRAVPGEPILSGSLQLSKEYLFLLTTGEVYKPDFDMDFPAKRITTQQDWEDVVLSAPVNEGISEIKNWLRFGKELKNNFKFGKKIKNGFKVLFTGPPGTGKTLTASLLGKSCAMDVYRVDLSMVVSKYIGETEKNLSKVFDMAENKNWILFFDEADALFGKRSQTTDSHDRYANQEVSYLLQRIEDFDGLVILCSNFKNNIDEAFFRRFQLVLDFEIPDHRQRFVLWKNAITDEFQYDHPIDLEELSEKFELTGAGIINVLHFCTLKALERGDRLILKEDILAGIKIEKIKQGKSILH
ncbi:ATPases of the AAA+ class [Aquiflexum balticum DSM 16537]|uniref:ATPases of the AAA+ class n=1 Tax=Aquiflexum balticum DSM 16537 TaxID=758820 RepID=A0A1W2H9V3_9BACT|nr:ATP-binding protein [Aquiflexum balticum]SMD45675.1 ATPases of the AAA+ class [Aquiflexum balticum DSM 16537]